MIAATIVVHGIPAPKGSKAFKGLTKDGKAILVESSKRVKPWSEAVKWAIVDAGSPRIEGPVRVDILFTLVRPKKFWGKKHKNVRPTSKAGGDGDKLTRATWDCLTVMGVIEDDSRIVEWSGAKHYEGSDWGMQTPGAVIQIAAIGAAKEAGRNG